MKFTTSTSIALILALYASQINAQSKKKTNLAKTTATLTYAKVNGNADTSGWPYGLGYTWATQIGGQAATFKLDFNTKNTYAGDKAKAGWGISCATPACTLAPGQTPQPSTLEGTAITTLIASAPLQFSKTVNSSAIPFYYVQSGNPFSSDGSIGLAPGAGTAFWTGLRTAVNNAKGNTNIQFSIKGGKLVDNMVQVDNADNAKNLKPSITFVAADPKTAIPGITVGPKAITSVYASHGFTGATITLPYTAPPFGKATTPAPKDNIINLVATGDQVCIAPDLPYVFAASLPQATINQIDDTVFGTVCKGAKNADDYKTKCTSISSAPTATITVNKQKLTLKGSDWVYPTTVNKNTVGKPAVHLQKNTTPSGIFAPGAPCEGATFALGRNFFTKYSLTIGVDTTGQKYTLGFAAIGGGGLGWLIWVGAIALVVIVIGVGVFFFLGKGGDSNDDVEEDFAKPLNE